MSTPVETLTAAIARLEQLKADSTPNEWIDTYNEEEDEFRIWSAYSDTSWVMESLVSSGGREQDNALIVTLHRTIDAQIAILDNALSNQRWHDNNFVGVRDTIEDDCLALAHAILGEGQ